jgi:hypothetical protein
MTPWLCKRDRKTLAADFRTILRSTTCPPEKIEAIAAGMADKLGTDPEISKLFEQLSEQARSEQVIKTDVDEIVSYFVGRGGPVHPTPYRRGDGESCTLGGMTLRDHFAGQALLAIAGRWQGTVGDLCVGGFEREVCLAYSIADAMLKERAK